LKRLLFTLIWVPLVLAAADFSMPASLNAAAATPPPPPPSPGPVAAPTPVSAGAPQPPSGTFSLPLPTPKASGTPAPPEDDRKGLDGVWEVQIQLSNDTIYDHFKLTQKASLLTGIFLDNEHGNKEYPVAGSVDGKNIRLVVTKKDGTTMTFTGTVDGTTDMIGIMQNGSQQIAFTAAYRPKYRFLDTISPVPGGIGTGSSGGPGYPPR